MTEVYHFFQPSLFPSKECTSCHIEKPLDEFYKSPPSRGSGTHQSWCKECWNKRRKLKRLNATPRLIPQAKVCSKCGFEKSIDDFYTASDSDDLHKSACKECCDKGSGRKKVNKLRNRRDKPVTSGYKWCYVCEQERPIGDFHPDKTKRDDLSPRCKTCCADYRHVYWEENKESLTQRHNEWYAKPENQLKASEHARRRSARILASDPVDYKAVLERDGAWCYICEKDIDLTIKKGSYRLTFDHVIPLVPRKGTGREPGPHTEENLKPAHKGCNSRKHNQLLEEMTPRRRYGIV